MSERETLKTAALDNELVKRGRYDDRHRELLSHSYDLERENARLKEELEEAHRGAAGIARNFAGAQARVTELETKLAEALAYVEAHMDEDITDNGQANDGMSLRMILRGEDR
jgi:predicted  nucleic acid-binding Zn-ribbon protein